MDAHTDVADELMGSFLSIYVLDPARWVEVVSTLLSCMVVNIEILRTALIQAGIEAPDLVVPGTPEPEAAAEQGEQLKMPVVPLSEV